MSNSNEVHIELSVELAHDLRDGEDDNRLVINKGNHHQTFEKLTNPGHPHTITWTLTGNASSGEFCALNEADNPGFIWLVRTPNDRIFHKLRLLGKNKLTMHNHHQDKKSEGIWHYQLFARVGGKVYGVPLTFCCGIGMTDPNPSIKNT
jgi:hypothetical protein